MPKKIKTEFGFEGNMQPVELDIPDNDPRPWDATDRLKIVGSAVARVDAVAKVTGQAKYTYDISRPGMLYARILRSTHAAAKIKKIDTRRAESHPAVKAIEALPVKKVIFAGQELVAVAATSARAADDALRLIEVEYEPLPFVWNVEQAMLPGAPQVHEANVDEKASEGELPGERGQGVIKGNIRGPQVRERGDIAKGFAEADVIVEATFKTQVQLHSALETHGIVAEWQGDKLTVWASTQGIFSVRDELADIFQIPRSNVRVITEHMGGGFGAKFGAGVYGMLAAKLARKAAAPVKLMLTRKDEQIASGNRPNSIQRIKLGATKDGVLTAMHLISHGTGGIAGGAGTAGPLHGIYDCPNKRTEESDVFINAGPSAAMRAPGHPQGAFALESCMDMLAEKLSIDPLQFRLRNDRHPVRLAEFERGAAMIGWERRNAKAGAGTGSIRRGIGLAGSVWYNTGRAGSACRIVIHHDASVEVFSGCQDLGTGIRTVIVQIVAEELGIPMKAIKLHFGDTSYPFGPASGGSSTTPSLSPAVRAAAVNARERLAELVREPLGVAADAEILAADGKLFVKSNPSKSIDFRKAAARILGDKLEVTGERKSNYKAFNDLIAGVQFAEVEVDIETGKVKVVKIVAVHDCGRVMNRLTLRSQINGGIIQGLSYALYEDRVLDPQTGRALNPNLEQYKIAGSLDMPEIESFVIDVYNGSNNTGTLGIGEPATIPTAAAIANAVYNAIGARIYELPITPARVLEALSRKGER